MPRLNFFTPYLEEKKSSPLHSKVIIIFAVIFLAAASYLVFQLQIHFLEKNLIATEQDLNTVKSTQLNEVLEVKKKIAGQLNYQQMAERLQKDIADSDFVRVQLMERILENVPLNLYFQDLRLTRNDWQLLGFANDRQSIAKFEYNLKESGIVKEIDIKNINISTIVNKGEVFIFNMIGTFNQGVVK